jgi:tetratricopeptide (TPR) repeat protein
LTESETAAVAEHLLGATGLDHAIQQRIVAAAEGNPLFIEQLVSMLVDEGAIRFEDGEWRPSEDIANLAVPPSIHALLAARLDRLAPDERAVVEPASVIGHLFVRDAVRYLAPEGVRSGLDGHLGSLTEKQLVEADRSRREELGYRFHHVLIRDTAYEGILKRARATFHERFVEWADGVNREGATEYEEILGYHLEQAHRYLAELGPLDAHGHALGADGARRLAAAGRRAFARGDVPAAANLLGRAVGLLPELDPVALGLRSEHGEALLQLGRFQEAETVLNDTVRQGEEVRAVEAVAHASLVRLLVRLRTGDDEGWRDEAAATIAESMAVFEEHGDQAGLAKGWRLLAWSHGTACHFAKAAEASERALYHAEIAADVRQQTLAATAYAAGAVLGPTPVGEAIDRCETAVRRVAGDRQSESILLALLASLKAMQGSFEEARDLIARSRSMLDELGLKVRVARVAQEAWRVEMLAGDIVAAERCLREGYDLLSEVGEKYLLSTLSGLLGQTLYVLERFDEVEKLGQQSRELATPDDIDTQALWRCVLAKTLARRGDVAEAEGLVREALDLLSPTDAVLFQYGALLDHAEVLRLAGRPDESRTAITDAVGLAQLKQAAVMTTTAESMLAETTASTLVP